MVPIPGSSWTERRSGNTVMRVRPNKQLQRTVRPQRGRAASASFHCAHAARRLAQRAAAELRR